jgi:hypothetical protein
MSLVLLLFGVNRMKLNHIEQSQRCKKTEIVLLALNPFCFLFDEEEKKRRDGFQYTLFFLICIKTKALITKRGAFQ